MVLHAPLLGTRDVELDPPTDLERLLFVAQRGEARAEDG